MNILEAVIIGVVQGVTEFLPVSSSGHLVLTQEILGIKTDNIYLEVITHFGTLFSILFLFRHVIKQLLWGFFLSLRMRDMKVNSYSLLSWCIILGTIPAVIAGFLFKDFFEGLFKEPSLVGVSLIVTALILFSTRFASGRSGKVTLGKSFLIGLGQALAIIPGISRSGTTISVAYHTRVEREQAAEFSFFLAIPAILGATILESSGLLSAALDRTYLIFLLVSFFTAFISGCLAIKVLLKVVKGNRFHYFAPYCALIGILTLFLV